MGEGLQKIKKAAEGLLYRSESDYPFEVVHLKAPITSLEEELISSATKIIDAKVEWFTLEHFFRNIFSIAIYTKHFGCYGYNNVEEINYEIYKHSKIVILRF